MDATNPSMSYDEFMKPAANRHPPSASRDCVFYYDGDCGFCRAWVRVLAKLDLLHRVRWVPYQSLPRPPRGLTLADLDRAAYLETASGRRYEGFYAFRQLARQLIPLLPLYPLLLLPGVDRPGVALYRWVASNRRRLWPGPAGGCAIDQTIAPPTDHANNDIDIGPVDQPRPPV